MSNVPVSGPGVAKTNLLPHALHVLKGAIESVETQLGEAREYAARMDRENDELFAKIEALETQVRERDQKIADLEQALSGAREASHG